MSWMPIVPRVLRKTAAPYRTSPSIVCCHPTLKKRQEKTRVSKSPPVRQKPVMARDEIQRLRCACFAAVRYFEAEAKGNNAEAKKSKAEFFAIFKMGSVKPSIFGDPLTCRPDAVRKTIGCRRGELRYSPEQDPLSSAAD